MKSMTPRERWLAIVSHETPDRVPVFYRATEEATAKLMDHLGFRSMDQINERFHIERGATVGPRYVGPPPPEGADLYGRRYTTVEYPGGVYRECINSPLAEYKTVEEIEDNYTWPSPDDYDFSGIPERVKNIGDDLVVSGGGSEPFLIYKHLRGDVQAFIDMIENPEIVHYCLGKLYGLCYENARRTYEQAGGRVDKTGVAEDMGAQDRLLYSREHLQEYFFPYMKKMIDLAHEAGVKVDTHSDGDISEIIPDLIELGVDILNPIQWRCGKMDRRWLKENFGDKLVFEGGMDNQHTLPFGSVEEVVHEVRDNLEILGAGGGYVLGPCHNIQVVGPPENVVAMYDTCWEEGVYS